MQIGQPLPRLDQGVVTPQLWNRAADILNAIRNVTLSGGLVGSYGSNGLAIGAAIQPQVPKGFPYGSQHGFGITWDPPDTESGDVAIKIWNPLFLHAHVLVPGFFTVPDEDGGTLPKRTYLSGTITNTDWSELTSGLERRVGISVSMDTVTNTPALVISSTISALASTEVSPAPLRYLLTPLYILKQTRSSGEAPYGGTDIYMHFVRGIIPLPAMG